MLPSGTFGLTTAQNSLSALDNQKTVFHLGGSMSSNIRDILREKKQNHISNLITHKGKQSLSKICNDPVTTGMQTFSHHKIPPKNRGLIQ